MKLAESKRYFVFNEGWNTLGALGIGDLGTDTYIANAFSQLTTGASDTTFTGNEILDPLLVLRLTVTVNYGAIIGQLSAVPGIRVSAYLVAINNQLASTTAPRITSLGEDTDLFVRHPDQSMRWMFNGQNVTVIKKKTIWISGREVTSLAGGGQATNDTRHIKITKRLRGRKQFEQGISAAGVVGQSEYLKGWNYYWIVVSQINTTATAAVTANPLRITGDRFTYYKDF